MGKVDPNDSFRRYSNIAITRITEEFDRIRKEFIRRAYDDIQEITSDGLKTQANFMFDFIENNLEVSLKTAFKKAIADAEETIITEVNHTVHRLQEMETPLEVHGITTDFEDAVDNMKFNVRLTEIAEEFKYELRSFLARKFGYMNSRDIENAIDEIGYNVYKYLERKFEGMEEEIRAVNEKVQEDLYTASGSYTMELMSQENVNAYEETNGQFTFRYDGHEVVYRYDGNDFNCYKDGKKLNNSTAMEIVNREIQERFPQAQSATDAMLRRISEMQMDNQINPDDPFGPLLDRNGNPILDMPVKKEEKESEPISKEEIDAMLGSEEQYVNPNASTDPKDIAITPEELKALLEITDDEPKVEPITSDVDFEELMSKLEIKDDDEEQLGEAPIDPAKTAQIREMTEKLDIKDEDPTVEQYPTKPKDGDIAYIQERMDTLMSNPAVAEFIELQNMMKKYYEEYTQTVNEQMQQSQTVQTQEPAVLPDAILL